MDNKRAIITTEKAAIVDDRTLYSQNTRVVIIEHPTQLVISDGYHTMAELYDHRIALFIKLCKLYSNPDDSYLNYNNKGEARVWRSMLHEDGSMFDGQFILGINTEPSTQITYHLPLKDWQETEFAITLQKAPKWDGHTSDDVLDRLKTL